VKDEKEGPETLYYKSGMPKRSAYYSEGLLQCTVIEFYESGAVRLVENYRNGKKNGISKEYFESGQLKAQRLYRRGEPAASIEYDESGRVIGSTEEKKDFDFLRSIPRLEPLLEWAH
jgi:antitoxin component YwqK of YwqJK toxin-antitoxin module